MDDRGFDEAVQDTVEQGLNPVHFGRVERTLGIAILILAAVSATASTVTLILTW